MTAETEDDIIRYRRSQNSCCRKGFLGETLREFRNKVKMNQSEVAQKCNLSLTQYNHYETGQYSPDIHKLIDICRAINADPLALISAALVRSEPKTNKLPIEAFENTAKAFHRKIESLASEDFSL